MRTSSPSHNASLAGNWAAPYGSTCAHRPEAGSKVTTSDAVWTTSSRPVHTTPASASTATAGPRGNERQESLAGLYAAAGAGLVAPMPPATTIRSPAHATSGDGQHATAAGG